MSTQRRSHLPSRPWPFCWSLALVASLGAACADDDNGGGAGGKANASTSVSGSSTGSVVLPGTSRVRRVPLDALATGPIDITLGPADLGATFWTKGSLGEGVLRLDDASGRRLVDQEVLVRDGETSSMPVVSGRDFFSRLWTLPSGWGDRPASLAGTYTLSVVPFEDAITVSTGGVRPPMLERAVAFVREGAFGGGAIDFTVLAPEGLNQDDHIRDVLARVMADFAGLVVGDVEILALPADALVLDSREEAVSYLVDETLEDRPRVNVMVTTAFGKDGWSGFGDVLRGESPLIGIPFLRRSPKSTIFLRLSSDAAYDATVLRHELGHFAGLYHTQEVSPLLVGASDIFEDTPFCSGFPQDCGDPVACGCNTQNLMFPIVAAGTEKVLSPGQVDLIQRSIVYRDGPLVMARETPGAPPYRPWDRNLSARAETALGTICGRPAPVDASDAASLMGLATDGEVSPAIRRAAFEALADVATLDALDAALDVALDATEPRDVRLGAIAFLGRHDALVLTELIGDADPAVAQYAANKLGR